MRLEDVKKQADKEILTLALEQPAVFEELVDRYKAGFIRAAFRIVNNREEAEDIAQEAFIKIYLNAKKFREVEGASFKSWVYKIVINTALTRYGKLKRANVLAESLGIDLERSGEEQYAQNFDFQSDAKTLIEKVLEMIPAHLGEVLKKYYLEGKSQKDIAAEEGASVSLIKMRLFRAKRSFKKAIESDENLARRVPDDFMKSEVKIMAI